jgi:hypothetical protein
MGAALATLLASPAFAQSYNPSYGTGNVNSPPAETNGGAQRNVALPSYPNAPAQAAAAEHLSGARAEAPTTPARRHGKAASQQ